MFVKSTRLCYESCANESHVPPCGKKKKKHFSIFFLADWTECLVKLLHLSKMLSNFIASTIGEVSKPKEVLCRRVAALSVLSKERHPGASFGQAERRRSEHWAFDHPTCVLEKTQETNPIESMVIPKAPKERSVGSSHSHAPMRFCKSKHVDLWLINIP